MWLFRTCRGSVGGVQALLVEDRLADQLRQTLSTDHLGDRSRPCDTTKTTVSTPAMILGEVFVPVVWVGFTCHHFEGYLATELLEVLLQVADAGLPAVTLDQLLEGRLLENLPGPANQSVFA